MSSISADTRKRGRGSKPGNSSSASGGDSLEHAALIATLRTQLLNRLDEIAPMWASVATRYHTAPILDAVLSAIGKNIATSLQSVAASTEKERQRLVSLRNCVHAAIDERFDELLANINTARITKTSALERELLRIDEALEQIRHDHAAAREAVSVLDDAEFTVAHDDLSVKLNAVATMSKMPIDAVEPALCVLTSM